MILRARKQFKRHGAFDSKVAGDTLTSLNIVPKLGVLYDFERQEAS